jgi:hypothetical protein
MYCGNIWRYGKKDVKSDIKELKSDVKDLKNRTAKIEIKLEELDKKVDLSLEGHKTNTEQLITIFFYFTRISAPPAFVINYK